MAIFQRPVKIVFGAVVCQGRNAACEICVRRRRGQTALSTGGLVVEGWGDSGRDRVVRPPLGEPLVPAALKMRVTACQRRCKNPHSAG